ncbi:hypothetical protein J7L05_00500 [bacterium]|nr:hypothetical protein [bacterium]
MSSVDFMKDFLALNIDELDSDQIRLEIEALQTLISNPTTFHNRIVFLQELAFSMEESHQNSCVPLEDPLTREQHLKCVEKGIIQSYDDNDVSAPALFVFAHSEEGLGNFTDALFDTPKGKRNECWNTLFDLPFDVPEIDMSKVFELETTNNYIHKIASDWNALIFKLFPPQKKVALGFRNATSTKPSVDLDSQIPKRKEILNLLTKLSLIMDQIEQEEIRRMMLIFPLDKIKGIFQEAESLGSIISNISDLLRKVYSIDDLIVLKAYFSDSDNYLNKYENEFSLIYLILKSAGDF